MKKVLGVLEKNGFELEIKYWFYDLAGHLK